MLKSTLFFLHFLLFYPLLGQETDSTAPANFPMIAYWDKGEVLTYEVVKGKKKLVNDVLSDSAGRSSTLTLTIADSTEDRYLIDIHYDTDMNLEELGIEVKDLQELGKKFKSLRFRYETTETGVFKGYHDLSQLQSFYGDVFDLVLKKKGLTAVQIDQLSQMRTAMTSEAYVSSKSFEEIPLLHTFYGKAWPLDTLLEFPDSLPNMFEANKLIPAFSKLIFQLDEEEAGIGHIYYETTVDQQAMQSIMDTYMKTIKASDNIQKDVQKLQMNMQDTNYYVLDMDSGTILSFYRERIVQADDTTTVLFLEMNLK